MILLIDAGNSRLKWALATAQGIGPVHALAHAGAAAEQLEQIDCDRPSSIYISSVLDAAQATAMTAACEARWQQTPCYARSRRQANTLRSAYREASRLGIDRWLALRAAWEDSQGACVVVDAGTALTVDLVDASGQHQGGIIAAGLATSRRALLGGTRFHALDAPFPQAAGLGRDTETCVAQGALMSCLGAIERVTALAPEARRYLCGGDAPLLLGMLAGDWIHRPELVLQGLHLEALEATDGA